MALKDAILYAQQNPDSQMAGELRRKIESGNFDQDLINEGINLQGYDPIAKQQERQQKLAEQQNVQKAQKQQEFIDKTTGVLNTLTPGLNLGTAGKVAFNVGKNIVSGYRNVGQRAAEQFYQGQERVQKGGAENFVRGNLQSGLGVGAGVVQGTLVPFSAAAQAIVPKTGNEWIDTATESVATGAALGGPVGAVAGGVLGVGGKAYEKAKENWLKDPNVSKFVSENPDIIPMAENFAQILMATIGEKKLSETGTLERPDLLNTPLKDVPQKVGSNIIETGKAGLDITKSFANKTIIPIGKGTLEGGKEIVSSISGKKPEQIIGNRIKELTNIEKNNSSIRNLVNKYNERGIDVKDLLSKTDLLQGTVDANGTIRTTEKGGPSFQLREFIKPQEKVISQVLEREGAKVNLKDVKNYLLKSIDDSSLEGESLINAYSKVDREILGLKMRADKNGDISLGKIQDAKINKYDTIDYSNKGARLADKTIARGYKELVENNTKSVDVKSLNEELSKHYAVLDFLEKLDGKKVEGGKLGKYVAETIGGMVGSHFGPLGTIIGSTTGGIIKGGMMSSKLSNSIGKGLEQSELMKSAIEKSK